MIGRNSPNSFAYLAEGSKGRERGLAAQGACNITASETIPKNPQRTSHQRRFSQAQLLQAPKEKILSPEERQALYEAQIEEANFRNTAADSRHPTERSFDEQELANQLDGISLGPDSPDDVETTKPSLNITLDEDPMHISHPLLAVLEARGLLDESSHFQTGKAK